MGERLLIVLIAFIVPLTSLLCGCVEKAKPQAVVASITQIKPRVVLIRGFQDWYSTGIDQLAEELRNAGADAVVYPQARSKDAADELITHPSGPLVLIGFSYGADDSIRNARRLAKQAIAVDLLITIDPVTPPKVPANVQHCVNYYQSNGVRDMFPWLRGIPLEKDSPSTSLDNFDLRKNRQDLLQNDTSHATIAAHDNLHKEIVRLVVGVTQTARTLSAVKE